MSAVFGFKCSLIFKSMKRLFLEQKLRKFEEKLGDKNTIYHRFKNQYGFTLNHFLSRANWRSHFSVRRQPPSEDHEKDWLVLWLIDSLTDWLTQSARGVPHGQKNSKDQQENVTINKSAHKLVVLCEEFPFKNKHWRQDTWFMWKK